MSSTESKENKDINIAIEFDKLISGTGSKTNMGDTGAVYTAKINNNFEKIKLTTEQVEAILLDMAQQMLTFITAGEIKSLNISPTGVLQYSTDGETYQDCIQWGKIRGSLTDQEDLMTVLNEKASMILVEALQTSLTTMQNQVNENTTNIANNAADITQNKEDISNISIDIDHINNELLLRPLGNGIRQIRVSGGQFQYSLSDPSIPNPTWNNVSESITIYWGQIKGDLQDQEDLVNFIESKVQDLTSEIDPLKVRIDALEENLGEYDVGTLADSLKQHIDDQSNPHNVTKEQVGLGNVDNTSDIDKPVSTAQQDEINAKLQDAKDYTDVLDAKVTAHMADETNPHKVTKEQIGLENVDNVADKDKPLSDAMINALYTKLEGVPQTAIYFVNQEQYDAITDKNPNALYFIDETRVSEDISFSNCYLVYDSKPYYNTMTSQEPIDISLLALVPYVGNMPEVTFTKSDNKIIASISTSNEFFNQSQFEVAIEIGG